MLLIIDRDYAVAATVEGTEEAGLVEGQGDADLRMSLVEPGTLIEGDESVSRRATRSTARPACIRRAC